MLFGADIPIRLVFRAFDDLHTIALAAEHLADLEARAEAIQEVIEHADERLEVILDAVNNADARLGSAVNAADRIDVRVGEVLEFGDRIEVAAAQLSESAEILAHTVVPLQGLVGRMGRIADRLPGGKRLAAEEPPPGG